MNDENFARKGYDRYLLTVGFTVSRKQDRAIARLDRMLGRDYRGERNTPDTPILPYRIGFSQGEDRRVDTYNFV